MKDPHKIFELVTYLGSKKSTEQFRQLKMEFAQSKIRHFIKDKPVYQQASQEYKSMYCVCKVCGLKICKCKDGQDLLPFSSISNLIDTNESIQEEQPKSTVREPLSGSSPKASTRPARFGC